MINSLVFCVAIPTILITQVTAAPPISVSSPSLFPTTPGSENVTGVIALGNNPPQTPFWWESPGGSGLGLKFTSTFPLSQRTSIAMEVHQAQVIKALEESYFETFYHLGPQGGGWTAPLGREFVWPGTLPGTSGGVDLKVTPSPGLLTWNQWSAIFPGLYWFQLKFAGYDFGAEIVYNAWDPTILGEITFSSRT